MPVQILEEKPLEKLGVIIEDAKEEAGIDPKARVQLKLVIDRSPSMDFANPRRRFYADKHMQRICERVLALSLAFDDDGNVPVYLFDEGVRQLREVLTKDNYRGYLDRNFPGLGSGTSYAPFVNQLIKDMEPGYPTLVITLTDGDNYDKPAAKQAFIESSRYPMMWKIFAIYGDETPEKFSFLENLDDLGDDARLHDNIDFKMWGLMNMTDDQLYRDLLDEFAGYHKLAQSKGLLDSNFKWNGRPGQLPTSSANQPKKSGFSLFNR
jgi:hypothetical protein